MTSCIVEDELEAIEAVLSEDYKLMNDFKDINYSHCFQVYCFPCDDLDDCHCSVQLNIKIPKDYPNIVPLVQIISFDGISQNTTNNLLKHLNNKLNDKLKQEMLYDIIDITKEFLQQYNFIGANIDEMDTKRDNEDLEFEGEEDDGFGDDNDGGWDDINEDDEDLTFNKSLQSIEKIMKMEEEKEKDVKNGRKNKQIKYKILKLEDVIDDNISSPRLLAVADVYQLAMSSKDFYAECRALQDDDDTFEIRIGIKMSQYIENQSLLNCIGLWHDDYMVIRFHFSCNYINDVQPPKIVEIGKSVPHKNPQHNQKNTNKGKYDESLPIKLKNKLQPFIGGRSIMNRINNKLFARLWPATNLSKHYPLKYKQILQLMAMTNYSYDDCKMVLYNLKDYEKALVCLTKNDQETNGQNEGLDSSIDRKLKIKQEQIITKDIELLCEKLISYGITEMLQKRNDDNIDNTDDGKNEEQDVKDKEFAEKSAKQCIENQLRKFLKSTSNYFMHNILMQILYFALHSTITLSKRCLVCDINFPSYSGLIKPTVCKNTLCMYGHQELEIGFDIASILKDTPEIVDLLITFCFVAAKKNRMQLFSPIEVHGDPPNQYQTFKKTCWGKGDGSYYYQQTGKRLKSYNVLDTDKLKDVLSKMPSIDTLLSYAKKGGSKMVKKSLSYKTPLLWPLLRWLISTNRSYLIPLRTKQEKFDGVPSSFQFKFVSYSPEREFMFKELSRKNNDCGTIWGFHGSPLQNWHTILRTGLKNMSNTKNMRNGSVYGNGIYLAPNSGTSYWYCEPSKSDTWPLSMFNKSDYYGRKITTNTDPYNTKHTGHGLYCLALCEILNHPKLKSPEPYFVVPTESWVMIRYLFVFNTVDNKFRNNWRGKGRYFDIEANKLIKNYIKKQQQLIK